MTTEIDDFLAHYGVLGMKWGVRKDRGTSSGPSEDFRKTTKKAVRSAVTTATKTYAKASSRKYKTPAYKLTDSELNSRINRMTQEKKYKELNASYLDKGRNAVTSIVSNSGKVAIGTILTAGMVLVLKKGIEKKWGPDLLKDMFPKKKK